MGEARPVYVRLPREIHELLKDVAEKRGESVSDFIRRATLKELVRLGYLPEDYAKALGVRAQPHELACDGGEPEEPKGSDGGQRCYTCSTSSPAEGLKRALQALKESFEKAGVEVEIFDDAVEALTGKPQPEVSQAELVRLAAERYPGYPLPLAMAKVLNDLWVLRAVRPVKGLTWGGVHEENIPDIVAKLVRSMYEGPEAPIRAITVRIEVKDPSCEDYTHFWVEILDVEHGPDEELAIRGDR